MIDFYGCSFIEGGKGGRGGSGVLKRGVGFSFFRTFPKPQLP